MPRTKASYSNERESAAQLVERHAPMVKRIAHHLAARLPATVQVDDLIQAGLEGLLEAARSYQSGKGASFETFAGIRIRGAMLDEIRRGDWSPRSVHRNARSLNEAHRALESTLGRSPTDSEVAEHLGVELSDYHSMARHALSAKLCSFEDEIGGDPAQTRGSMVAGAELSPEESAAQDDLRERLIVAINTLPERDQLLLNLYYQEELNLKEIGKVLGVSESRVSQLHAQAAARLRAKLQP